jgi:hypothetical protein
MLNLPKRPGPYVISLLVTVLIILAAWLNHALNSPAFMDAIRAQKNKAAAPAKEIAP